MVESWAGRLCKLCHMWKFGFCLVSVEVPRAPEPTWGSPGQQHLHGLGAEGPTVPSALRRTKLGFGVSVLLMVF